VESRRRTYETDEMVWNRDRFPDLMATALRREDVHSWAGANDIKLIRSED
jgi:hypothetical protein